MATSVNPRRLLREPGGKARFCELLTRAGYSPQQQPLAAMCNSIYMATPLLLEGQRGGGKTAFPEAVARALGLPLFTLPCLHDTTSAQILFSWDTAGQHQFVAQETQKGVPLAEVLERQWSLDFVKLGEVLDAFHYASGHDLPPVVLVDEIDKLSHDGQTAFLQILARGFANVPRLRPTSYVGFAPDLPPEQRYWSYPIVVLTSNNMGAGVSSPLLSRARFCYIPSPTLEEMAAILAARVPAAQPRLLYHMVKLVNGINGLPLLEKPALREFIMLMETFVAYGYTYLTGEIIADNLDCVAKTHKDMATMADAVDSLFRNFVEKNDEALDTLVRQIYQRRRSPAIKAIAA